MFSFEDNKLKSHIDLDVENNIKNKKNVGSWHRTIVSLILPTYS